MPEPVIYKRSEIAALSHEEYMKRRDEIVQAQKEGRIENDLSVKNHPAIPREQILEEVEEAGGELYKPAVKQHFLASDVAAMTPEEYRANNIRAAYLEGRVHEDRERKVVQNQPAVLITEDNLDPRIPQWQRKLIKEGEADQAERAAKIEADKSAAQRYLEHLRSQQQGDNDDN